VQRLGEGSKALRQTALKQPDIIASKRTTTDTRFVPTKFKGGGDQSLEKPKARNKKDLRDGERKTFL